MKKIKHNEILEGVIAYVAIHDFDWRAIFYLSNDFLFEDFNSFLSNDSYINVVNDIKELPHFSKCN